VRIIAKPLALRTSTKAALALCLVGVAVSAPCESKSVSDQALAREYVLAACIMDRYPNAEIAREAEVWAEGLVERGTVPAEAYGKLAELAHADAPAPLQSRSGVRMLLQSCVELYDSPALAKKIAKLVRR
jgi:hypothetical protein